VGNVEQYEFGNRGKTMRGELIEERIGVKSTSQSEGKVMLEFE